MSRAAAFTLLKDDATLNGLGFAEDTIFGFMAVPEATPQRFMVMRWGLMDPGVVQTRGPQRLALWLYDVAGSYDTINAAITRIKEIFADAVHVVGVDGFVLTQAKWDGDSDDYFDDAYDRITRWSQFTILSR